MPPKRRRIMGSLLIEQTISTLFAPSGVGKSFFVAQAAIRISQGLDPFPGAEKLRNERKGKRLRVLMYGSELTESEIFERHGVDEIQRTYDHEVKLNGKPLEWFVYYERPKITELNEKRVDAFEDINLECLEAEAAGHPFDVLIIDNTTTIYPGLLSGNEESTRLMDNLRYFRDRFKLAVFQVMHVNKQGDKAQLDRIDPDDIKGNKNIHVNSEIFIGINESLQEPDTMYLVQFKLRNGSRAEMYTADHCAVFSVQDEHDEQGNKTHAVIEFVRTSTERQERQRNGGSVAPVMKEIVFEYLDECAQKHGVEHTIEKIGAKTIIDAMKHHDKVPDSANVSKQLKDRTVRNYKQSWKEARGHQ